MARTILVVDDNETNLRLIKAVLQTRGYALMASSDGESALAALDAQMPDLVLLDVQMPGLSGLEVVRRLRTMPHTAHLPVVAITAMAMKGDREAIIGAGFDDYLAKPYRTADVIAIVIKHLPPE